jgi:hypothetical protein
MGADIRGSRPIVPRDGWRRSTRCNIQGNCVELNLGTAGAVLVRDSKAAEGVRLEFAAPSWATFLRTL